MTSRPATTSLRRRLGTGTAALVTAVGLSACQVASPIATDFRYDPADGTSVILGTVEVLDVLVVSTGPGEPGVLSGLAVNEASQPVTLSLSLATPEGERIELSPAVEVPANGSIRIDGYDPATGEFEDPVLIPEVPVAAGQLITVRLSSSTSADASERVPVLLPDYPYGVYDEILASSDPTG